MELRDTVAVITGGSGGIGRAMARAFLDQGARTVVLADLDAEAAAEAAAEIAAGGGRCEGRGCDVTVESEVAGLVESVLEDHGPIDLFCSNAGSGAKGVLLDAPNESWQQQWDLHVMSHVYAARAVVPAMVANGGGYLLNTASAAGLLAAIGSGPYTVTKAAAVKLAEFLAITHGDEGIKVSVLCPQGSTRPWPPGAWATVRPTASSSRRTWPPSWSTACGRSGSTSCPTPRSASTSSARPTIPTGGSGACADSAPGPSTWPRRAEP